MRQKPIMGGGGGGEGMSRLWQQQNSRAHPTPKTGTPPRRTCVRACVHATVPRDCVCVCVRAWRVRACVARACVCMRTQAPDEISTLAREITSPNNLPYRPAQGKLKIRPRLLGFYYETKILPFSLVQDTLWPRPRSSRRFQHFLTVSAFRS